MIQVSVSEPPITEVVVAGDSIQVVVTPPDESTVEVTQVSGIGPQGDPAFVVWNETPAGVIDGSNAVFTLAQTPVSAGAVMLFKNGLMMTPGSGNDYTISGSTITFTAGQIPLINDALSATYGV